MTETTALWVIDRLVVEYVENRPSDHAPADVVQMVADYISECEHAIDEKDRRIADLEKWLGERTEKLHALQSLRKNAVNCGHYGHCALLNDESHDDLFDPV